MNCRNPSCKVGVIRQGQYGAEGDAPFAARLASGFCSPRCKRLAGPLPKDRPKSTLEAVSLNYERPELTAVEKEKTPRDAAYLDFVRTFDCVECGWPAHLKKIDAHHIETGGTSIKCSDYLTVPLCAADARGCHAAADKSPESAEKYRPVALMFNTLWIKAGHRIKKGGE